MSVSNAKKAVDKVSAIIFDMDGTLLDTEKQYIDEYFKLGNERGMNIPEELPYACMGLPRPSVKALYCQQYGDDFDYEEFRGEMIRRVHLLWEKEGIATRPGVIELLKYCRENNIPCGIATSTLRDSAVKMLKKADIYQYFDVIVCGDEIEKGKPNPDIFLQAAKLLNTAPELCIGAEDSRSGIKAVAAAGMTSCFVVDVLQPDEEIKNIADYICTDMFDILNMLKNSRG